MRNISFTRSLHHFASSLFVSRNSKAYYLSSYGTVLCDDFIHSRCNLEKIDIECMMRAVELTGDSVAKSIEYTCRCFVCS